VREECGVTLLRGTEVQGLGEGQRRGGWTREAVDRCKKVPIGLLTNPPGKAKKTTWIFNCYQFHFERSSCRHNTWLRQL